MIIQGWEFRLDDDGVYYEKLINGDHRIVMRYENENFFHSSDPIKVRVFVNSIEMTPNNGDSIVFSIITVKIEYMKKDSLSVIINDLFDLEDDDNVKLLFYFNVDEREGKINNLL